MKNLWENLLSHFIKVNQYNSLIFRQNFFLTNIYIFLDNNNICYFFTKVDLYFKEIRVNGNQESPTRSRCIDPFE